MAEVKANEGIQIMEKLKEHRHKVIYTVLVVIILLLLGKGKQERYALSSVNERYAYVLDTKTSELWLRALAVNIYLGTNENPMSEAILLEPKDEQK